MPVVTVAQQKGGAGKTTLVVQLATALCRTRRNKVALVDIDPQASLTAWMRAREAGAEKVPALGFAAIGGWRIGGALERLKREAGTIVVDSPPHAAAEAKEAIRVADIVLVPCQPSPPDVWASKATFEIAAKEGKPAFLVLNRVPPRGRSLDEARALIAEEGHPVLPAELGNRQIFVQAFGRGLGAVEAAPRSIAAREVRALAEAVRAALAP